jgi:hypothetical protein
MGEACAKAEWSRTASLMALIANVNRDPSKQRAFEAKDFYPFEEPEPKPIPKTKDLSVLRTVFVDRKS